MRRAYPPKLTVKADVANLQPWAIFNRRAPSPLTAAYPQIVSVPRKRRAATRRTPREYFVSPETPTSAPAPGLPIGVWRSLRDGWLAVGRSQNGMQRRHHLGALANRRGD